MGNEDKELPLKWKKVETIAKITSLVLVPIVLAIIGALINNSIKGKELKLKYVELAVNILKEEPNEKTKNLREWAIKNINDYSQIKMSAEVQKELEKNVLFSVQVAEFTSDSLRTWLTQSPENLDILAAWLKKNNISAGPTFFLITDEYAKDRQRFLIEQGVWQK